MRSVVDLVGEVKYVCAVSASAFVLGVFGECTITVVGSSRNSTFISLPCLELGGGGFFRALKEEVRSAPPIFLSSSGSDISCDVRRDSE